MTEQRSTCGSQQAKSATRSCRPCLEQLESRLAPAVYHVDTFADSVAVDPASAKDAAGHVSLRSAVMAANANPGADTIVLGNGAFALAIAGPGEDTASSGDLDIHGDVTILGQGSNRTLLDGRQVERLFQVHDGTLRLEGLTLTGGNDLIKVEQGAIALNDVAVLDAATLTAVAEALARQGRDNTAALQTIFAAPPTPTQETPDATAALTGNQLRTDLFGVGGGAGESVHETRRPDFTGEGEIEPLEGHSRGASTATDSTLALHAAPTRRLAGFHEHEAIAERFAAQLEHEAAWSAQLLANALEESEAPLVLNMTRLTWHDGPAQNLLMVAVLVSVGGRPALGDSKRSTPQRPKVQRVGRRRPPSGKHKRLRAPPRGDPTGNGNPTAKRKPANQGKRRALVFSLPVGTCPSFYSTSDAWFPGRFPVKPL